MMLRVNVLLNWWVKKRKTLNLLYINIFNEAMQQKCTINIYLILSIVISIIKYYFIFTHLRGVEFSTPFSHISSSL